MPQNPQPPPPTTEGVDLSLKPDGKSSETSALHPVKRYTSYGGMMLYGTRCDREPEEFVDADAFDALLHQLEEAREERSRVIEYWRGLKNDQKARAEKAESQLEEAKRERDEADRVIAELADTPLLRRLEETDARAKDAESQIEGLKRDIVSKCAAHLIEYGRANRAENALAEQTAKVGKLAQALSDISITCTTRSECRDVAESALSQLESGTPKI